MIEVPFISNFWKRHRILENIGTGAFGKVLKIRENDQPSDIWAIKLFSEKKLIDKYGQDGSEKCIQEYRILTEAIRQGGYTHPRILRLEMIYRLIYNGHLHYGIIMEYIEGKHLGLMIESGEISRQWKHLNSLMSDSVSILDYLHNTLGIVHRDIKPDNFIWDPINLKLKIVDFGFAGFYRRKVESCKRKFEVVEVVEEKSGKSNGSLLCDVTTVFGTPYYIAPEMLLGSVSSLSIDDRLLLLPKTDVWSLGVMLYQVICGILPYGEGIFTLTQFKSELRKDNGNWLENQCFMESSEKVQRTIEMCLRFSTEKRVSSERLYNYWFSGVQ